MLLCVSAGLPYSIMSVLVPFMWLPFRTCHLTDNTRQDIPRVAADSLFLESVSSVAAATALFPEQKTHMTDDGLEVQQTQKRQYYGTSLLRSHTGRGQGDLNCSDPTSKVAILEGLIYHI